MDENPYKAPVPPEVVLPRSPLRQRLFRWGLTVCVAVATAVVLLAIVAVCTQLMEPGPFLPIWDPET